MMLIIVEGSEASGKTTLAYKLSDALKVPVLVKDEYKAELKKKDPSLNKFHNWVKLERMAHEYIYEAINSAIKNNESLIVEGNYQLPHKRRFQVATRECQRIVDIECYSRPSISIRRYIDRNESVGRPDGFNDIMRYLITGLGAMFTAIGLDWYKPMKLSNYFLKIDTSDFSKVNYDSVIEFVKKAH